MSKLLKIHSLWWYAFLILPYVLTQVCFYWLNTIDGSVIGSWAHALAVALSGSVQTVALSLFLGAIAIELYKCIPLSENIKFWPVGIIIVTFVALNIYQQISIPLAMKTHEVFWYDLGIISSLVAIPLYFSMMYKVARLICCCEARSLKPPIRTLFLTWIGCIFWVAFLPLLKRRANQQVFELTNGEPIS
ncbi:hypothetical protein [Reinekea sp. G2M2-21]|uniref:hypothetical protein n=1 Tax=Reinekea sp. G2M2-21 TaxID=2788942 RepID=UPI0018AB17C4|nr:hypothetical protein [Reinekea sp. G2M2-21]